ncbi:histidine kinase [Spirosoma sp. SC4-14]|uniref:sensor histidine kinase n=1 Tax=Spirosoma sp. SC4-14 TaxID=3128900 RepID=UPI0030CBCF74
MLAQENNIAWFKAKSKLGNWVKRIGSWLLFLLFIRYIYFKNFYSDREGILNLLTANLFIQTIVIYYVFSYYIFPKTLYQLRWIATLLWLLAWQIFIYEYNYILFLFLSNLNHGTRLDRDWQRLYEAGLLGFISNGWASFWSFFYSFPFAIMGLTAKAIKDIILLQTKTLLLEKDKLNLELDLLRSQVNPHFLFNTLNSVYARIFDTDEKAADLILRLSELMRYNLYETDLPKIALDKELAYIQNYLDLERNRLSDRYVVIDYDQSGNPSIYQITPLLLITFVENAFKHGIRGATEPAYVQVSANLTEGLLTFQVENSIPEKRLSSEPNKKSGGIGLGNVRRRLDTLYKDKYELITRATKHTYEVTLTIQVEDLP